MNFNLEDYEPVEVRIKKFYKDHPDGRILTEMPFNDGMRVVFKAFLYIGESLVSTGYAEETKDDGYVNKTSHVENCETSAIGRALANYDYSGDKRPSREEMTKVQRGETKPNTQWKNTKPTVPQINAVLRKATYKKEIQGIEQTEALKNEVLNWNAGLVSDYIGNKIELDEARKLVHAGE